MRLFLRPYHVFPILSNFSLSYLCSCWVGYLSHHPRLFFFSTQRERKLNGSSLIVALVSLFSFLKATKWIAFHSSRSDVSTVSIISQLSYGSIKVKGVIQNGNAELWSTLSIHDHSPWPVSINFWKLAKESSIAFVKYIS